MSPSTPNERALGIPRRNSTIPTAITDFFLSQPQESIVKATTTSRRAMALVIAAKKTRMKNAMANTGPPIIESKTLGSVPKISQGPCPGSRPNTNTAGKIATPARSARAVSIPAMIPQLFSIFSFFER